MQADNETQMAPTVIHLMKGVLYRDQSPALWQALSRFQGGIMDYVSVIGLDLVVDDLEGFAYLKQIVAESEEHLLPRLIQRRPLSYPLSLLCVLLRKKLAEADAGGEEPRVMLNRDQIREMLAVFLPPQSNEARIVDQIDSFINKLVDYGFLRKLKTQQPTFEVRRILISLVDADWLADLEEKMRTYYDHAEQST